MRPADEVLREVFAERVGERTPATDMYHAVLVRHRRHRRRTMIGAALAAVVVLGGVAVVATGVRGGDRSLPATPTPTRPAAPTTCIPTIPPGPDTPTLPPAVPADQLPAQSGVRGSLAGDQAVVDAALVAGWQGLRDSNAQLPAPRKKLDPASLRVRFVERAGTGTLALVTAADEAGSWQAAQWVEGQGRTLVPVGGSSGITSPLDFERRSGQLFYGTDPLYISAAQVCGLTYGVVLAPAGTTATLTGPPHVDADARLVPPAARPVPLQNGLAVFPADLRGGPTVAISRDGTVLGRRALNAELEYASPGSRPAPPSAEQIDAAVRDGRGSPDRTLVERIVGWRFDSVDRSTNDGVTGVRVLWGGRDRGGHPWVLVALRLPSGAWYVSDGFSEQSNGFSSTNSGLLAADRLDDTLFVSGGARDVLLVAPKAAARVGLVLSTGEEVPVQLTDGGAVIPSPNGARPLRARAYDANGRVIASQALNDGLIPFGH
jgi:hypothetical protein